MKAKFIVVGGKANKEEIALNLPSTIGRSRDADLTVSHPMVSRLHCEIYESAGQVMVRDLGSLNGTLVDGQRITAETALPPGSEFTVGPLTFRADYQVAPDEAAEAAAGEDEVPEFVVDMGPDAEAPAEAQDPETVPVGPDSAEPAAPVGEETTFFSPAEPLAAVSAPAAAESDEEEAEPSPPPAKPDKPKKASPKLEETIAFEPDEAESKGPPVSPVTSDEEPAVESEAAADNEGEETADYLPAQTPSQRSQPAAAKKGWWPFGKDKAAKSAKAGPSKKPAKPAKPAAKPDAAAKKSSKPQPSLEELAFEAVLGDEEQEAAGPAKDENEGIDDFLEGLK